MYNNNLVVLRKYVVEFVDILLCERKKRKNKALLNCNFCQLTCRL